jgi:hypothetical protein
MAEVAAHLSDHVLPTLPIRQWVLSLPKRLRPFLHRDPALAGAVLRILLRAIRATLGRACPGAPSTAQLGAVSFIQRFGGSLNAHFHFHVLVLDGLTTDADDGSLQFHEVVQLTGEVERTVQRRVLRHFVRRGLLEDYVAGDMPRPGLLPRPYDTCGLATT